jgi:hypothetical protein
MEKCFHGIPTMNLIKVSWKLNFHCFNNNHIVGNCSKLTLEMFLNIFWKFNLVKFNGFFPVEIGRDETIFCRHLKIFLRFYSTNNDKLILKTVVQVLNVTQFFVSMWKIKENFEINLMTILMTSKKDACDKTWDELLLRTIHSTYNALFRQNVKPHMYM